MIRVYTPQKVGSDALFATKMEQPALAKKQHGISAVGSLLHDPELDPAR